MIQIYFQIAPPALTEHHLVYILNEVHSACVKWHKIGLCLGIHPATLDVIQEDINHTDDRYEETLRRWIKRGATMRKLVEALESNLVQENQLAGELREKYRTSQARKGINIIIRQNTVAYACLFHF